MMMKLSHLASVLALICLPLTTATAKSLQVTGPDPHAFSQSRTIGPGEGDGGVKVHRRGRGVAHYRHSHRTKGAGRSVSLAGVVAPLAAKAIELVEGCGSKVVSAIAGRGNRSNHPSGHAVDLQGNPSCMYAKLKDWPGGVSTDYETVMCQTKRGWVSCPHVHISYAPGGQEWGRRFTHRGPAARHRYAHAM
jgi:hypothetical protein